MRENISNIMQSCSTPRAPATAYGRWAAEYGHTLISFEDIDSSSAKELIALHICTGGEPVRKDDLIRLCEKHQIAHSVLHQRDLIDEAFCRR
ncbi:MAG: hypothetical protein ACLTKG_02965 [Collinsella intestinalis]